MSDQPAFLLRSHCPGGPGCFCDGAEHVYVRDTPPRTVSGNSARSRRASNQATIDGVDNSGLVKVYTAVNSTATKSVAAAAPITQLTAAVSPTQNHLHHQQQQGSTPLVNHLNGGTAGHRRPAGQRQQRRRSPSCQADLSASSSSSSSYREYLAYSSDEEFEEFMKKPKTDYTYSRSVSYTLLSPERVGPPNMSRPGLHSPGHTPVHPTAHGYDRYDLNSSSSTEVRTYRREVTSHYTTSSSASSSRGPVYSISPGLDVDSGDEEWTVKQNNNLSKSAAFSYHAPHQTKTRWTVRSVVSTALYPLLWLWLLLYSACRRLLLLLDSVFVTREHRPSLLSRAWSRLTTSSSRETEQHLSTSQPPPPDSVDYRRWLRGIEPPSAARSTHTRYNLRSRSTPYHVSSLPGRRQPPPPPSVLTRTVTLVTSTVTTVTTTVVTVVSYLNPVRWAAAVYRAADPVNKVSSAASYVNPISWARHKAEVSDLPRRGATVAYYLNPVTWVRSTWEYLELTELVSVLGYYLNPVRWVRSTWQCLELTELVSVLGYYLSPVTWFRSAAALSARCVRSVASLARRLRAGGAALVAVAASVAGRGRQTGGLYGRDTAGYGRYRQLTAESETSRRRRVCLCLLPLLLLALLLIPLLMGLWSSDKEEDTAEVHKESVWLTELKSLPYTAWSIVSGSARYVGSCTAAAGLRVYEFLALLGSSAAMLAPSPSPAPPPPVPAPVPVPAAVDQAQLAALRAQLDQLTARITSLQADYQRCEAAAAAAREPAALRTALGLPAQAVLLSENQLKPLYSQLAQLRDDFYDLHNTLLVVQEMQKQMKSCCNQTDPDWSALLSQRLRDMEQQLDDRIRLYAANIKQDLVSEWTPVMAAGLGSDAGLSREEVLRIARQTLAQYDADKTGRFDYALESAGGSVISTKCTEGYHVKTARISVLGIPLWYPSNNPRTIIQPSISPGECFAFRGPGYFVISLSHHIVPTEFVMEHIPKNLTPSANISSAPKDFLVLGLRNADDQEGSVLGEYVYQESGPPLQTFPVQRQAGQGFDIVELRVTTNWGHPEYTCLYRFRVHGEPQRQR